MLKNYSNQSICLFAFTQATNLPRTGLTNITGSQKIDGASRTSLSNGATEIDSDFAPGYYTLPLTQAETNGDTIFFWGVSATGGVSVIAIPARIDTLALKPVITVPQGSQTQMEGIGTPGQTYDFFAYDNSNPRLVWNGTSFESMNPLSYAQYRITATEQATQQAGRFYGVAPTGTYFYELRARGSTMVASVISCIGSFNTAAGDALEASVQKVLRVAVAKDD